MITYKDFPSLLFVSYNKDNAPKELPFEVASFGVRNQLAACKGFGEMFGIIASLNSLGYKPTNFWLNSKRFTDVEHKADFRLRAFTEFIAMPPNIMQYGCICFGEGGQYVYLLMPGGKPTDLGLTGTYFACSLFKENLFIGFEETSILKQGFSVLPTGIYQGGMDVGGYLSFCAISLQCFKQEIKPVNGAINRTKEEIWTRL